jgi:hypothetical protein
MPAPFEDTRASRLWLLPALNLPRLYRRLLRLSRLQPGRGCPELPDDCTWVISTFASAQALTRMRQVARSWRELADARKRWAVLLRADFDLQVETLQQPPLDLRSLYVFLHRLRKDMVLGRPAEPRKPLAVLLPQAVAELLRG